MSEKTMRTRYWPLLTSALALACSSSPKNIGDGELDVDKGQLASYAATWDGYVEAYSFQSGTDRVHVTLDANGNGSFQVGDGPLLAPPMDPNVGYPAALNAFAESQGVFSSCVEQIFDGIAYPVTNTRIESERIRLAFDPHAAFTAWCELQTPTLDPFTTDAVYGCAPSAWGRSGSACNVAPPPSFEEYPFDCGKLAVCNFGCSCDATSCTVTSAPHSLIELDAALDDSGHDLVGTLLTNAGPRTLRLKR